MDYKKILEHLCEIECELDDAYYSLPDYNANSDSQSYIDGARCTLYHLKDEIERKILDDKKDHDVLYNKEAGDGEGRLKGNN
tara:strand:- start:50 stop:295 length:246 start_codon:yes stop_codon:yes gene_type:complete